MLYFIIAVVGIAIIWTVFYYRNKAEQKKTEELEKTEAPSLKVNIPEMKEVPPSAPKPNRVDQVSLDALYADEHGMWVCARCETLNDDGTIKCSACGANK